MNIFLQSINQSINRKINENNQINRLSNEKRSESISRWMNECIKNRLISNWWSEKKTYHRIRKVQCRFPPHRARYRQGLVHRSLGHPWQREGVAARCGAAVVPLWSERVAEPRKDYDWARSTSRRSHRDSTHFPWSWRCSTRVVPEIELA